MRGPKYRLQTHPVTVTHCRHTLIMAPAETLCATQFPSIVMGASGSNQSMLLSGSPDFSSASPGSTHCHRAAQQPRPFAGCLLPSVCLLPKGCGSVGFTLRSPCNLEGIPLLCLLTVCAPTELQPTTACQKPMPASCASAVHVHQHPVCQHLAPRHCHSHPNFSTCTTSVCVSAHLHTPCEHCWPASSLLIPQFVQSSFQQPRARSCTLSSKPNTGLPNSKTNLLWENIHVLTALQYSDPVCRLPMGANRGRSLSSSRAARAGMIPTVGPLR